MRRGVYLTLFFVLLGGCVFAQALLLSSSFAGGADNPYHCVLETEAPCPASAALSRTEGARVLEHLRSQGTQVLETLNKTPSSFAHLSRTLSAVPAPSRQTALHQNLVARK